MTDHITNPEIAYEYQNSLYLNITNRCPTSCVFCIKRKWKMEFRGHNLNLKSKEPDTEEILKAISEKFNQKTYNEIVFCGYGEPTMRFDTIKEVCTKIKKGLVKNVNPNIKIRINTNGLGNLINKRNIVSEMEQIVDSLSISLNTADKAQWLEIMSPKPEYREKGFESVIEFIKEAKTKIPEVTVTAVDLKGVDTEKVKKIAEELGVKFRLRPILE